MTEELFNFDYLSELLPDSQLEGIEQIPLQEFVGSSWISGKLDEKWCENYRQNKHKIKPVEISNLGVNKTCIHIGASPAIKKQVDALLSADTDDFLIVSCNSAYKFLVSNYIKPDYVFAVEAGEHILNDFKFDALRIETDATLIVSPFVTPKIYDIWPGEIQTYFLGGGHQFDKSIHEDWDGKHDIDIGGGNVVSTSLLWAYKYLQCRNFIMTGMSLCFDDEYYYDNRSTKYLNQDIEKYKKWYKAVDMYGNIVNTTPALTMYKTWLETYLKWAKDSTFVNSTEAGILGVYPKPIMKLSDYEYQFQVQFVPWITIMPLAKAIEGYKNLWRSKK